MAANHVRHWTALPLGRSTIGRLDALPLSGTDLPPLQGKYFLGRERIFCRAGSHRRLRVVNWPDSASARRILIETKNKECASLAADRTWCRSLPRVQAKPRTGDTKVPVKLKKNSISLLLDVVAHPVCQESGYLPNGLKVPRCRVSQLLAAREAAGKPHLCARYQTIYFHPVPADRHDEPEMVRYLELEKAFEADFGFPFSSEDGWDPHFKRMTFHALVAENLRHRFNNDTSKIAAEFSKPLIFNVQNPYLDGDARQLNLEMELRRNKLMYEGADAVDSLPLAINTQFPFRLRFPCSACWGPAGYYDVYWFQQPVNRKYKTYTSIKRNSRRLLANPTHPVLNDRRHNLQSPRDHLRKVFAVAHSAAATSIWDPLGAHLPQSQKVMNKKFTYEFWTRSFVAKRPSNRLIRANQLVIQLPFLHIFCLPDLDIHPIELGERNVWGIVEDLPVRARMSINESRVFLVGPEI
ncbi:hypothetical protein DFH06DRAFT_1140682 [Mycena polygramma]|nr:hypothetical protein DFH06DRAFT_1140682 [Mycena polygramma]